MANVLFDFGFISILLFTGFWLRKRFSIFQKLYIPTSVIAGMLGLLLGPNVLGKFSGIYIPFTADSAGYANLLLALVFTTICIGNSFHKSMLKNGFNFLMHTSGTLIMQCVLGFSVIKILQMVGSGVPDVFGFLPSTGFYGGHGLGATVAAACETIGYWSSDEIISVATTFATIGLLYGIIGGIIFINIAARKGILKHNGKIEDLSKEELTGYIQPQNRKAFMMSPANVSSLEPLAVPFGATMIILLCATLLQRLFSLIPVLSSLNIIVTVAICAVLAQVLYSMTPVKKVIDPSSMKHISQLAMEFLIVISMANTDFTVIFTYGKEILICTFVILIINTIWVFFWAKIFFKKDWFEFGITTFGTSTGVFATGLLLLHVADPETRSDVIASLPISSLTSIITQTFCLSVAPVILVSSAKPLMIGMTLVLIVMCIAGTVVGKAGRK